MSSSENTLSEKYLKIDKKVERIVKKVQTYMRGMEKDTIRKEITDSYEFAKRAHEGQMRKSGDPYILHPVEAVVILLDLKPDIYTIQACFLHDVIEDTPITAEEIREDFWDEVAFLCEGMEKLGRVKYRWEERSIGSLRKMLVAMAEDLRVIFIKCADRLHNMKTLKYHPSAEKRERIALETLNIYSPIAERLWLFQFKNALQEECFKILEPEEYKEVKKQLRSMKEVMEIFKNNAKKEIEKLIGDQIKTYSIDFRVKSLYSIYNKMQRKWYDSIEELYDIFGIRIMVESVEDCYKILWMIHSTWTPVPKRFKDYIALPKPNWYKSLHTTIVGLLRRERKLPTEIQIKTFDMMQYSDVWVAAHFEYKEKGSVIAKDIDWVKELKEVTASLENNDFMSSLRVDVFKHRIFVFTPKGDSINLPAGSTPIDFAYEIHSDLWDHIYLAKANGKVHPLDKELHNGDVVEISIEKNRHPNPLWLSFVKTTKARNRIKNYLNKEDRQLHRDRGRSILNKFLEKAGFSILDKELTTLKHLDDREYSLEDRRYLLEQIGNFSVAPGSIIKRIYKEKGLMKKAPTKWLGKPVEKKKTEKREVVIGGEIGLAYSFCQCCKNKEPKRIVAHINAKRGITIHRLACKILKGVNQERILPGYFIWQEEDIFTAYIEFFVLNKIGVLKEVSDILFTMWINIASISTKKIHKQKSKVSLAIEIPDHDYFLVDRFLDRVKIRLGDSIFESKVVEIVQEEHK